MKIEISNIPGFFPAGYSEQLYIDSSKYRLKRDGQDIVIYNTPEKYKVKNDETYRNRKIQSIFYDKYILTLTTTESMNIDLLGVANSVVITLDNGELQKAELLEEPTYELLQDSDFTKVVISYRNLNSKSTINHLDVSDLTNGIASFKSGLTTTYTPVFCNFDVSEYDRVTNNDNSIQLVSRDNAFRTLEFIAYVSDSTYETIKRGMSAAYDHEIEFNGETYTALEVPEIIDEEGDFEGLKGIRVLLRYEQILNYPFDPPEIIPITIETSTSSMNFQYNDSSVKEALITTNSPSGWTIESVSNEWISAYKSNNILYVSVSSSLIDRNGLIKVTSLDDNSKFVEITIIQDETNIVATPNKFTFEKIDSSTKTSVITVEGGAEWEAVNAPHVSWINTVKDGNNLNITVDNSDVPYRSSYITVRLVLDPDSETGITINQGVPT